MVKPSRSKNSRGSFHIHKPTASVSRTKRHDPGRSHSRSRSQSPSHNKIMDDIDAGEGRKTIKDLEAFERQTHPTEDDTVKLAV